MCLYKSAHRYLDVPKYVLHMNMESVVDVTRKKSLLYEFSNSLYARNISQKFGISMMGAGEILEAEN